MSEPNPRGHNQPSLLDQLQSILESDPLIDEVGFVHPSQFADISDSSSMLTELNEKNDTSFLSRDHKLGISTEVIQQLYIAAKCAFMSLLEQYRSLIDEHEKKVGLGSDNVLSDLSSLDAVECELMKHSRVLLLLSSDFGTAWNCRKEVVLRKENMALYLNELQLSSLVLSNSPKSERAWSHR